MEKPETFRIEDEDQSARPALFSRIDQKNLKILLKILLIISGAALSIEILYFIGGVVLATVLGPTVVFVALSLAICASLDSEEQ